MYRFINHQINSQIHHTHTHTNPFGPFRAEEEPFNHENENENESINENENENENEKSVTDFGRYTLCSQSVHIQNILTMKM